MPPKARPRGGTARHVAVNVPAARNSECDVPSNGVEGQDGCDESACTRSEHGHTHDTDHEEEDGDDASLSDGGSDDPSTWCVASLKPTLQQFIKMAGGSLACTVCGTKAAANGSNWWETI